MELGVMDAIHQARNRIASIKAMVHFHMDGERRFTVEKDLDNLVACLNTIYEKCLICQQEGCDDSKR